MRSFIQLAADAARNFSRSRDGNVALIFAIALFPIIGGAGAAIDYGQAASIKSAMQAALDATALAMSKTAATMSGSELQSEATAYFAAAFHRPEAENVKIFAKYKKAGGSSVTVSGVAQMKTAFLGLLGFDSVQISASSTTAWGGSRLRVALVLDNTGSMASYGKMNALKTASRRLIDKLQNTASKPGDVYVSIIPFNKNVNVGGPGNYHANWIDWEDWDADNGHEAVEKACEKASKKSGKLANKCKNSTNWVHDNHNTWNGCVTDRDMDYDVLNTTPDPAIASTLFPAEQYMACPVELMPLTYNWTQLRKTIDDMTPVGNTNQTIGLAWGWQSLSNAPPLRAPPKDKDHKYQDVVILLTDGLNTENRWSNNQVSIDARTQKVCDNIKGAGITIYTVLVMAGNSSILQNCASDSAKYFKLDSADQMIGAFDSIGTTLSQLRISK